MARTVKYQINDGALAHLETNQKVSIDINNPDPEHWREIDQFDDPLDIEMIIRNNKKEKIMIDESIKKAEKQKSRFEMLGQYTVLEDEYIKFIRYINRAFPKQWFNKNHKIQYFFSRSHFEKCFAIELEIARRGCKVYPTYRKCKNLLDKMNALDTAFKLLGNGHISW